MRKPWVGFASSRLVLTLIACAELCACYPALKTEQPKVRLSVRDPSGAPVAGASFTLATNRYPFPMSASTTFATFETDELGMLRVPKRRDWLVQVMLPDGIRWYDWAYCIEKPGYRAVAAVEPDSFRSLEVVLEPSATPSVCKWPTGDESYYQLEVGEP
jgi:hypothetical protein